MKHQENFFPSDGTNQTQKIENISIFLPPII